MKDLDDIITECEDKEVLNNLTRIYYYLNVEGWEGGGGYMEDLEGMDSSAISELLISDMQYYIEDSIDSIDIEELNCLCEWLVSDDQGVYSESWNIEEIKYAMELVGLGIIISNKVILNGSGLFVKNGKTLTKGFITGLCGEIFDFESIKEMEVEFKEVGINEPIDLKIAGIAFKTFDGVSNDDIYTEIEGYLLSCADKYQGYVAMGES